METMIRQPAGRIQARAGVNSRRQPIGRCAAKIGRARRVSVRAAGRQDTFPTGILTAHPLKSARKGSPRRIDSAINLGAANYKTGSARKREQKTKKSAKAVVTA
jgi:hypothetical protein